MVYLNKLASICNSCLLSEIVLYLANITELEQNGNSVLIIISSHLFFRKGWPINQSAFVRNLLIKQSRLDR